MERYEEQIDDFHSIIWFCVCVSVSIKSRLKIDFSRLSAHCHLLLDFKPPRAYIITLCRVHEIHVFNVVQIMGYKIAKVANL